MKHGFFYDEDAISPVIGFALILAIITSTVGYMQTHFVPVWNAEAESEHFENVYQDMVLLSSNIESTAISGIPRTSAIRLGFSYPKRGIFYNPKTSLFGSLEINPDAYVNISYTTLSNNTYTKSYRSSTLKYELPDAHPYLVYEHGVVIRDFSKFGRPNATASSNTLVTGDNINIPLLILNGSGFSTISIQPTILPLYPIELTDKKDKVEYLRYVNITMDTRYPEVWRRILSSVNTSKTTAYVGNDSRGYKLYINTTAGNEIDLPDETGQVTQAGRLYSGMALVKDTSAMISYKGSGDEIMGTGTLWSDIPAPDKISQIIVTNITYIDQSLLNKDVINFKITDQSGHYWAVEIKFSYSSNTRKITSIVLSYSNNGKSQATQQYLNTFNNFDSSSRIDLFNQSNYVKTGKGGAYQNSSMEQPNSLISVLVGDIRGSYDSDGDPLSALVNYRLIIQ